ncbi:MAG: helix-turn-helix domain-containing protein, partial [Pseudomonadota bacterium]
MSKRLRKPKGPQRKIKDFDHLLNLNDSAFSNWLRRQVHDSGLSPKEISERSGVSLPAIYNIISGRIANPRSETKKKIASAIQTNIPKGVTDRIEKDSGIRGLGELIDFDPHLDEEIPKVAGVYVLYDISERPIYVGQSSNIRSRVKNHSQHFWFKQPIVETAAYIEVNDENLRKQMEAVLIRFLKSNAVI